MNQYTISNRLRMILIGGIILGIICLGYTWMIDDELHTRFWSNFLHNSVFFTGIAFIATFFIAVCITAWAGWYVTFKRIWEAYSMTLVIGFVLMLIVVIGLYGHWHHLYHWAADGVTDPESANYDKLLAGKSGFLNKTTYGVFGMIVVAIWTLFAYRLRALSIEEDVNGAGDPNFTYHRRQRWWAGAFLPIAGFSSAAMIWLWVMSVDSHWYSTMFAWYAGASWFVSMLCVTIITILYLKSKGYMKNVTQEHLHDLGKFLFGFSIFWTYLWFSQYMLIWYANVGEETIYFKMRQDNYPVLFWGNLLLNFVLPFFALMRNDTKRKFGSLGFVAVAVLFGHWWDFFNMLKPGIRESAMHHLASGEAHSDHGSVIHDFAMGYTIPGFLEIGTMIGFLCLFVYGALSVLSKSSLLPKNDPYLEESLHHHT